MAENLSLAHRAWRYLPAGPRRVALRLLSHAMAPRPDAVPPTPRGLAVGGELDAATGLGEAARIMLDCTRLAGLNPLPLTLGVGKTPQGAPPPGAALLLVVNAPSLPLMLARAPRDFMRGRRIIGNWAWELPVLPPDWRVGASYVHEVWAGSAFIAAALAPALRQKVRVVPNPLAMRGMAPAIYARADFGFTPAQVVSVMVLSLGSSFARKNPMGGIEAFRRAFGDRPDQLLVVKLSNVAAYPRLAARIMAQAAPNIMVIAQTWPRARVEALIAAADIVLSLHRAEGFGLVPAEAMLRGKPVVATGWSGNLAYMDDNSAALVGYKLVKVTDESGMYRDFAGARWAEPDIAHAAEHLCRLGDDADLRADLGARGQARAQAALNGAELRAALAENGLLPEGLLPEGLPAEGIRPD